MDLKKVCPLCHSTQKTQVLQGPEDTFLIKCPACKEFTVPQKSSRKEGDSDVPDFGWLADKHLLSGALRQRYEQGVRAPFRFQSIGSDKELLSSVRVPQDPLEQVEFIIQYIARKTEDFGELVEISYEDWPIAFCRSPQAFESIITKIRDMQLLFDSGMGGGLSSGLTEQGWELARKIRYSKKFSKKAFVAMSFSKAMNEAWVDGIELALMQTSYNPIRIDQVEHAGLIIDRILSEIRDCCLVVADFTEQKGGVYFEAGFALGLGIPVIWTVKKEDLEKLHFDIKGYNCVVWENVSELYEKLKNRISAFFPIEK